MRQKRTLATPNLTSEACTTYSFSQSRCEPPGAGYRLAGPNDLGELLDRVDPAAASLKFRCQPFRELPAGWLPLQVHLRDGLHLLLRHLQLVHRRLGHIERYVRALHIEPLLGVSPDPRREGLQARESLGYLGRGPFGAWVPVRQCSRRLRLVRQRRCFRWHLLFGLRLRIVDHLVDETVGEAQCLELVPDLRVVRARPVRVVSSASR
mmetsp:Transcript_63653/g.170387  ORF Transcript_63653/g.170387 Transcript_63653/m.170387 type:complete len:208 (-) Transcript_63653:3598-4221(-)